jgi:hypothetical protein
VGRNPHDGDKRVKIYAHNDISLWLYHQPIFKLTRVLSGLVSGVDKKHIGRPEREIFVHMCINRVEKPSVPVCVPASKRAHPPPGPAAGARSRWRVFGKIVRRSCGVLLYVFQSV